MPSALDEDVRMIECCAGRNMPPRPKGKHLGVLRLWQWSDSGQKLDETLVNLCPDCGVVCRADCENDLKPRKRRTVRSWKCGIVDDAKQVGEQRLE
jgi:hypothetical protein